MIHSQDNFIGDTLLRDKDQVSQRSDCLLTTLFDHLNKRNPSFVAIRKYLYSYSLCLRLCAVVSYSLRSYRESMLMQFMPMLPMLLQPMHMSVEPR